MHELTREGLVLMDITMPNCSGLEATRLIEAEHAGTKIVMVTVSDDDSDLVSRWASLAAATCPR